MSKARNKARVKKMIERGLKEDQKFEFYIGEVVDSPFGEVKIIDRWLGRSGLNYYDVRVKDGGTWTFDGTEMNSNASIVQW